MDLTSSPQPPALSHEHSCCQQHPQRRRYVAKACMECRRRKIKCSGEQPCARCLTEVLDCHYSAGPARARKKIPKKKLPAKPPTGSSSASVATSAQLGEIGNEWAVTTKESPAGATAGAQGESAQLNPLGSKRQRPSLHFESFPIQRYKSSSDYEAAFPGAIQVEIGRWNIQARLLEVQRMRNMVHRYMTQVNPRIPCLNGAQIDRGIDMLLSGCGSLEDQSQMETLVDLAMALIQVMTDEADESHQSAPPGWKEFSHAETRIYSATCNGVPNLGTIQCLVLKAMYLLYTGKEDMSYDTMAVIGRLVFRLGLHSHENWDLCSPFEIHMRQRIISIILRLDKLIAHCCKLPYLIRRSEVEVSLPGHVDDHKLQVNIDQLPVQDPEAIGYHIFYSYSHVNMLMGTWDDLMAVGKHARTDAATVALIDSRLESVRREVPSHLQWCPGIPASAEKRGRFSTRESMLLHLLLNRLRLIARQPWVEGSGDAYPEIAAQAVPIAIDTISSIDAYHQTDSPALVERHMSVQYLIEALQVLGTVVLHKPHMDAWTTICAKEGFDSGLYLLRGFASRLASARTALCQLQGIVDGLSMQGGESLLAGSLGECREWYDLLGVDGDVHCLNPSSGEELEEMNAVATGIESSCYIHTENWLIQQG